ncbi:MAG: ATP-binding protein [Pseudomonadota bacterium]
MEPKPNLPTLDSIQNGEIAEDQSYEFKARINFDDLRGKSNFIDDVTAFLNAGSGHLILGVHEKKGRFDRFEPMNGDRDTLQRRITSIIQDNIDPKPLGVILRFIDLDDSKFLIDIGLPEHRLRPYQNKITGGFYLRTGAQNTPIPRDQLHTLFTPIERIEADTLKLLERENAAVDARDIMQKNGATLHIAIVPLEHYQRDRAPFDPGRSVLRTIPHYHGNGSGIFKGCENGVEVRDSTFNEGRAIFRFFIGDDWLIHSYVSHPFVVKEGEDRLTLQEFRGELSKHLGDIQLILDNSGICGPFGILMAVKNLRNNPKLEWAFPNANSASMPRAVRKERIDDTDMVERFFDKVRGVSVYGR